MLQKCKQTSVKKQYLSSDHKAKCNETREVIYTAATLVCGYLILLQLWLYSISDGSRDVARILVMPGPSYIHIAIVR